MADNIYLETRVGRNQTHEPFDDEAEEQGESIKSKVPRLKDDEMMMKCHSPGDVKVALGPEQPHVHLHLGVQVAHAPGRLLLQLLARVLLHLADSVQEE